MTRRRNSLSSALLALVTIAALAACERGSDPAPTPTATIDDTFVIVTPTSGASAGPTPTPEGTRTYVVKAGDTLSSIAEHFGVTEAALIEINHLSDPDDIQAGRVLKIPPAETDTE